MPRLPLPPLTLGIPLDCGELVVTTTDDVAAEFSQDIMASQVAPIRDAIIAGDTSSLLAYQKASRYAAAQSDPLRANGEYLDEIGDEHEVYRQVGEPDDPPNAVLYGNQGVAYRQRILALPAVVDPDDIIATANAVLAPYTNISCRYAEASDGFFSTDGTSTEFSSHVFQEVPAASVPSFVTPTSVQAVPNYPDRLYPSATPAGLTAIANRRPPGAMLNGDTYGRWFLLRVPDIEAVDTELAAAYDGTQDPHVIGMFSAGSGASLSDVNETFVFSFASTSDQIYAALVAAVESKRMHSIRWSCIVDPGLTA